jgi:hypothetical protein
VGYKILLPWSKNKCGIHVACLGTIYKYCHIIGDAIGGFERKMLGFKIVYQIQSLLQDVIMMSFEELFLN